MDKLINLIPGSRLLISSLPGSAASTCDEGNWHMCLISILRCTVLPAKSDNDVMFC